MLKLCLLSSTQRPGLFKKKTQAGTTQIQEARIKRVQLENKKLGYVGIVQQFWNVCSFNLVITKTTGLA
jgi:hypothetical protein